MKIIAVDNLARDYVADVLVAEKVNPVWADIIVDVLNINQSGEYAELYFKAVPDDHKLWRGMEELV